MNSLYKSTLFHAQSLSAGNCSKVLASIARVAPSSSHKLHNRVLGRLVEKVVDSDFIGYSSKDVATILNALMRTGHNSEPVFRAASRHLQGLPSTEYISEKELGLIFNAYARAGIADRALFESLSPRIVTQTSSMSSQSCGNICHALGKLEIRDEPSTTLIRKLCERILKIKSATNQELSNVFHSLARLGFQDSDLLEPLVRLLAKRVHSFNPIEIAAVATAVSKLNLPDRELMNNMRKRVEKNLSAFSGYELTAVLHAFSQVDVPTPVNLFENVSSQTFTGCNPHTACIAMCAFGRVGIVPRDEVATALADQIQKQDNPQYRVDALFGLSRLESLSNPLLELAIQLGKKLSSSGFPENTANVNQLIFGISKLRSSIPDADLTGLNELYYSTLQVASKLIKSFDERHITNLLFSFANKAHKTESEESLVDQLAKRIGEITNAQLFSSSVESIARLDIKSASVWNTIERRLKTVIPDASVNDVKLAQAFAHIGRFKDESAQLILKRITIEKLSISSTLALLYTVLYTGMEKAADMGTLTKHLQLNVGRMTKDMFIETSALLRKVDVNVIPFRYMRNVEVDFTKSPLDKIHSSKDCVEANSSALITQMIEENLKDSVASDAVQILDDLKEATRRGDHECVIEALGNVLADKLERNKPSLAVICDSIPFLSPRYETLLNELVLDALHAGDLPKDLRTVTELLSLHSPDVRKQLLATSLPKILETSTKEELIHFMSANTGLFRS